MSQDFNFHSNDTPEELGYRPPASQNGPASTSVFLVGAAWAVSIASGLAGWSGGSFVAGGLVLAAIPVGIWGIRRARILRSAGRRRAIFGLSAAGVTLLLPIPLLWYVGHMREQAALKHQEHRLKLIGLSRYMQETAFDQMYPCAYDPDGNKLNPGLSWRVDMLPYLESAQLHMKFKLNEAWDSPANRPLANTPVRVFQSPYDAPDTADTRFHSFVGGGALFERDVPTHLQTVTDGTANTIMVVEARETAPWSKPSDLHYDPDGPLPLLGRDGADGFHALMADASVRFIRKGVSDATLRAAITRAGGDKMGGDW